MIVVQISSTGGDSDFQRCLDHHRALKLLTGVSAGKRGLNDAYPLDMVFGRAAHRLEEMAQAVAQWSEEEETPGHSQ